MKKQVLSVEQMVYLKKIGVDTSKASLYWCCFKEPNMEPSLGLVSKHVSLGTLENKGLAIGAFTLIDIIDLLPFDVFGNYNFWLMKSNVGYCFSVKNNPDSAKIGTHLYDSPLEAAFDILCWCFKKRLLHGDDGGADAIL